MRRDQANHQSAEQAEYILVRQMPEALHGYNWHDTSRNKNAVAELDDCHLQRDDSEKGRECNAVIKRDGRAIQDGLVYASQNP